ncbi:hypothetical protein TIFTF001_037083 [Ficus carica]|uniref:PGG domain-containing protein n=1 Tax=Ficus carica TaxID=3494 RepID=A0AA88EFM1_FICCA|nr:hypothetical protein TIFTF001_037083 [Ficus carica]
MEKLVECTKFYKSYGNTGSIPDRNSDDQELFMAENYSPSMLEDKKAQADPNFNPSKAAAEGEEKLTRSQRGKGQTPILIAAKNGVTEMVEKILEEFPVAIQDEDAEQKNIAFLEFENRQPHVYKFLLKKKNILTDSVFRYIDFQGNSALHLAATQCEEYRPNWLISGICEEQHETTLFPQYNKRNQTPKEVFVNTHKELIKDGSEWLTKTSESCSVVAALVATVAFATSATVPGGINEDKGTPTLEAQPAFNTFAISSLAALCFSITALVFFLSILTSRYQEKDFALDLPRKLLLGLTSLFASIACMLVSFCAGHIFVLNQQLRYVAYPLYAALCLPITFFAFAQLSLYFDLLLSIFKKVPQSGYEVLAH